MFFRRNRSGRWMQPTVRDAVDRTRGRYHVVAGEVDLLALTRDAFRQPLTADFQRLRDSGVEAEAFHRTEVSPCWDGLGPAARKAKLTKFVRVANAASSNDLGQTEIATTIRAKTLLLAWAYDHAYGCDFVERVSRSSRDFGVEDLVLSR